MNSLIFMNLVSMNFAFSSKHLKSPFELEFEFNQNKGLVPSFKTANKWKFKK